jgi:hypothetical protein
MTDLDLFGNERPAKHGAPAPVVLDLFDAAAEGAALETGRAKSQEHANLMAPTFREAVGEYNADGTLYRFQNLIRVF